VTPLSDDRPPLRPPQFTLRTLILLITVLAIFFSLVNTVHPVVMAGLVLLTLLIAAHVAGNVIGTRLREIGDRPLTQEGGEVPPQPFVGHLTRTSFAPPSDLARRIALGLPILIVTTAGVLAGGIAGGLWGYLAAGDDGWLNIVVGIVACGFLGGFGSFVAFSFTQVILGAWWQASRSLPDPHQAETKPVTPCRTRPVSPY
jgi:hypothetical protein